MNPRLKSGGSFFWSRNLSLRPTGLSVFYRNRGMRPLRRILTARPECLVLAGCGVSACPLSRAANDRSAKVSARCRCWLGSHPSCAAESIVPVKTAWPRTIFPFARPHRSTMWPRNLTDAWLERPSGAKSSGLAERFPRLPHSPVVPDPHAAGTADSRWGQ